ncbi:DUF2937 family protein [Aliishimia ponticola]|uniref:DUF2937 family protein n=1 Tax=Aliishimia ponticola TaxID=2499833 RepID=A0A4S4NGP8_9RHOB|nr:DUF2937 family protein [Aliishimia ponticola]THH37331.1 DUF2937 family protein [Aliishimia ponticola]
MILRALTLAGGLTGAAAFSQFPEASQQYVQRLGGAVDALGEVAAAFDRSASAEGLTREAALAEMTGSDFVERRRKDMTAVFAQHEKLSADLAAFRQAGPFMRAYHISRVDTEIARAALAEFKPALPLTLAGGIFAGAGFLFGSLAVSALGALVPRRRGRRRLQGE